MLTRDDIVAICPPPKSGQKRLVWDGYVEALTSDQGAALFDEYDVNTTLRMCHALATMVCETNLTVLRERGDFSAPRIVEVFGAPHHSSAISEKEARSLASLPVNPDGSGPRCDAVFERAYGLKIAHCCKRPKACLTPKRACQCRTLGNTQPGDGAKFRGALLNQLTGREAHERVAKIIGCPVDDLVQPIHAVHAFLIEWDTKDCNRYADNDDAVSIRKLINGGSLNVSLSRINGLPEAVAAVKRAKRVITPQDFETAAAVNSGALASPPASMAVSTEGQMAVTTGGGGAITLFQGAQAATMKAASTGDLSAKAMLLALLAEPLFWTGLLAMLGGAYWWFKRRRNLYLHGV